MPIDNALLDAADLAVITEVLAENGDTWENPKLVNIKRKIKKHYRDLTGCCCYCLRSFRDEFNMVIDIEHVLPKVPYNDLMFELYNLHISCKRCNMEIKKNRVDFLVDAPTIRQHLRDRTAYKLVHPNLDTVSHFVLLFAVRVGQREVVKYLVKGDKGEYNRQFFEYDELEVESLDVAQGINDDGAALLANLPANTIADVKALLNQI